MNNESPTCRARETAAGLLKHTGITQRRAADLIGMSEKRISERVQMGTLFWRDFLTIASSEEGGADYLRMLADEIDGQGSNQRPIDAAQDATETAAGVQARVRQMRADHEYCHNDVRELAELADALHAAATRFKDTAKSTIPGPVRLVTE